MRLPTCTSIMRMSVLSVSTSGESARIISLFLRAKNLGLALSTMKRCRLPSRDRISLRSCEDWALCRLASRLVSIRSSALFPPLLKLPSSELSREEGQGEADGSHESRLPVVEVWPNLAVPVVGRVASLDSSCCVMFVPKIN